MSETLTAPAVQDPGPQAEVPDEVPGRRKGGRPRKELLNYGGRAPKIGDWVWFWVTRPEVKDDPPRACPALLMEEDSRVPGAWHLLLFRMGAFGSVLPKRVVPYSDTPASGCWSFRD